MRITIRLKIFGIAVAMLVLMAGVSVLNWRQTTSLIESFRVLADDYFQAFAEVSEGQIASHSAAALHRRLLMLYIDRITGHDTRDLQASLNELIVKANTNANQSFAKGSAILKEAQDVADDPWEAEGLARIRVLYDEALEIRNRLTPKSAAARAEIEKGNLTPAELIQREIEPLSEQMNTLYGQVEDELRVLVQREAQEYRATTAGTLVTSAIVLALTVLLGLAAAYLLARSLTHPVRRLVEGTRAVEEGNFDLQIPVTTRDEIGHLTRAFNHMIGELKTKDRIREMFGKYVDPKIVSGLIDRPELAKGEGERRIMTISFTDLEGFTRLSEGLSPATLVRVINAYLTEMSRAIHRHDGVIDKFIGDAVMAYWGPPFVAAESQIERACAAALDQVESFNTFRSNLPELLGLRRTEREVDLRIGIAMGDVVIGDIGSDIARNYTVLGDTVNIASRLESVNKIYGTRILLSEEAAKLTGPEFLLREIDQIVVAGKTEAQRIYELVGRETVDAKGLAAYAEGLTAWRRRDWQRAHHAFVTCLQQRPGDGAARVFLERLSVAGCAAQQHLPKLGLLLVARHQQRRKTLV